MIQIFKKFTENAIFKVKKAVFKHIMIRLEPRGPSTVQLE